MLQSFTCIAVHTEDLKSKEVPSSVVEWIARIPGAVSRESCQHCKETLVSLRSHAVRKRLKIMLSPFSFNPRSFRSSKFSFLKQTWQLTIFSAVSSSLSLLSPRTRRSRTAFSTPLKCLPCLALQIRNCHWLSQWPTPTMAELLSFEKSCVLVNHIYSCKQIGETIMYKTDIFTAMRRRLKNVKRYMPPDVAANAVGVIFTPALG